MVATPTLDGEDGEEREEVGEAVSTAFSDRGLEIGKRVDSSTDAEDAADDETDSSTDIEDAADDETDSSMDIEDAADDGTGLSTDAKVAADGGTRFGATVLMSLALFSLEFSLEEELDTGKR